MLLRSARSGRRPAGRWGCGRGGGFWIGHRRTLWVVSCYTSMKAESVLLEQIKTYFFTSLGVALGDICSVS